MAITKAHQRYRLKPTTEFPKGRIVPGVTTIIDILNKPALVPWANRIGLQGIDVKRYVDDKADIGTLAHAMIINQLLGKKTDTSEYSQNQIDAAENACLSFYEWQKKHNLLITSAEEPLISQQYGFGGQYDIYGVIDNTNELLDLKTGSGIWLDHYYQMGGYLLLLKEYNRPVDQVRILNIPRTESETFQEVTLSKPVMELAKIIFLQCLAIYNTTKEMNRLVKK